MKELEILDPNLVILQMTEKDAVAKLDVEVFATRCTDCNTPISAPADEHKPGCLFRYQQ